MRSVTPPDATAPDENAQLSSRALFSYALPAAPVQFMYMLFLFMYLKYASNSLGASPAVVGTIFLVAKVWDAVNDPLVGNLSDRTHSRLGRRRPWLLGSALPIFFFGVMAWVPPESLSGVALNAWIAVAVVGFYTSYSCFDVPHMALGAEITLDRQSRNRVFGARQFSRAAAMLLSAGAVQVLMDDKGGRESAFWLVSGAGVLVVLGIVFAAFSLPSERDDFQGKGGDNPFGALRDVLKNHHARLILFVYFIESLGVGAIGILIPFLLDDVMEVPELTGYILGLTFVLALLSIPAWVALARRFEKRHLWLGSMMANAVGFGMMLFMGKGTWPLMVVSAVIVGLCNSCGSVLGSSIKAEVVDYDEYETGERKEGAYFAAWSFVNKLAAGIMVFVVGVVLEYVGYVPEGPQTDEVKNWILALVGGMPFVGYVIGSIAFTRFSLSEAEHERVRAELDARAGSER